MTFHATDSCIPYRESFFEWTAFPVVTEFQSSGITCGLLQGWHHTLRFSQIEYHEDKELFYFLSGSCVMMFCDLVGDMVDMDSMQMVRIPAGTELEIGPRKGHFIAVAEEDTFKALVISPVQDAPRVQLTEEIVGK